MLNKTNSHEYNFINSRNENRKILKEFWVLKEILVFVPVTIALD